MALALRPEQHAFTPSVEHSLAEAYIRPLGLCYEPLAIYAGQQLVGFCSFAHLPESYHLCILSGFLIDQAYQGRGYGRSFLQKFLAHLRRLHPECHDLRLTVHPQNQVATHLYVSLGFTKTGLVIDGEEEMRLVL